MILKDYAGDSIDLSDGYRRKDIYIPLSLIDPNNRDLIDNIKCGYADRDHFISTDIKQNISCKICNTDKFQLKYGNWCIIAICPNCKYEIPALEM